MNTGLLTQDFFTVLYTFNLLLIFGTLRNKRLMMKGAELCPGKVRSGRRRRGWGLAPSIFKPCTRSPVQCVQGFSDSPRGSNGIRHAVSRQCPHHEEVSRRVSGERGPPRCVQQCSAFQCAKWRVFLLWYAPTSDTAVTITLAAKENVNNCI